jgi:2-polyprenyl-3-methyl-5-hydroxy-6-metoxy-1,4-benzoquinol methylase
MFGRIRQGIERLRRQAENIAQIRQSIADIAASQEARARAEADRAEQGQTIRELAGRIEILQREQRAILRRLSLPPAALWRGRPPVLSAGQTWGVFPNGALCRQDSFEQPYFSYWTTKLHLALNYHRKTWEFVFIAQALEERGVLAPGARGLGFGVGEETLPACLADMGCRIVGTDMAAGEAQEKGWIDTHEHAAGKEALRRSSICADAVFDANVDFQTCDMNAIPDTLRDFDFCWSACALEHLGSIELGLRFILNSVDCLKPGGWAVHTTEFNLDSNDDTVDNEGTVLFRRRDFEDLAERLARKGCVLAPIDYDPGHGPMDRYVDLPPYLVEPHLKLALAGYATTSVGLIIHKPA